MPKRQKKKRCLLSILILSNTDYRLKLNHVHAQKWINRSRKRRNTQNFRFYRLLPNQEERSQEASNEASEKDERGEKGRTMITYVGETKGLAVAPDFAAG